MARHPTICRGIILNLLLLLSISNGICTVSPHKVVLILTSGLSVDTILGSDNPTLSNIVKQGALALLNCNTPSEHPIPSVTLSILSGARQQASRLDSESCEPTAWNSDENAPCKVVYERRTGWVPNPRWSILSPNFECKSRKPLTQTSLGSVLGCVTFVPPPFLVESRDIPVRDRVAASALMNGRGEANGLLTASLHEILISLQSFFHSSTKKLLVLFLPPPTTSGDLSFSQSQLVQVLSHLNQYLLYAHDTDLMIADMFYNGAHELPTHWKPLTILIAEGPNFPSGLLSSYTTRTDGVVSDTDVAPTVLSLLGVDPPVIMTGRRMSVKHVSAAANYLAQLNKIYLLNTYVSIHTLPVPALLLGASVILSVWFWRKDNKKFLRIFRFSILLLLASPIGLLITPAFNPVSPVDYVLFLFATMLFTVCIGFVLSKILQFDISLSIVGIDLFGFSWDTLNGQQLQKISLPGNYAISGIRYYGIGNELLGIVMGFLLIASFIIHQQKLDQGKSLGFTLKLSVAVWLWFSFLMGWPTLGANSGSILVSSVGFGLAWWVLKGREIKAIQIVYSLGFGVVVSFLFAAIDRFISGSNSSQAGEALYASSHGRGVVYLIDIVERKLKMNIHLLFSPYLLIAAISVSVLLIMIKFLGGSELMQVLKLRPVLMKGMKVFAITLLVALVVKDSGFVIVIYAVGSGTILLVWNLLQSAAPKNNNTVK